VTNRFQVPDGITVAERRDHSQAQDRAVMADESASHAPRGMFRRSAASMHAPGWERRHWASRALHRLGDVVGLPGAGILAAALVVGWVIVGISVAFPTWWQNTLYAVTSSVTFVMVFVIQHTQERHTSAMHRKLDELIRSSTDADDTLIAVEEAGDEQLDALAQQSVADREQAASPE
jgi:low affinity Fe/Cu permease